MINLRTFRKLSFSSFIALSVAFCLLVYLMANGELLRMEKMAQKESGYIKSLLACSSALGEVESANFHLLANIASPEVSQGEIAKLKNRSYVFRRELNTLSKKQYGSKSNPEIFAVIVKNANLADSAARASAEDNADSGGARETLLREDISAVSDSVAELKKHLEILLESELAQLDRWRSTSFFFHKRLQLMLIVFFVISCALSVSASFLFSVLLKKSLKGMRDGTAQISSGNLKFRFKNIEKDETGALMYDFNMMARRLERQTESLQKAKSEIEEKAELLAEANRHKDSFLANMSHELRTPLNSIIGFAELIEKRASNDEKLSSHSRRILVAAEHLLELISSLLDIAKADAGALRPSMSTFDLSETLSSLVSMMAPLAQRKNIELRKSLPEGIIICSDERFVKQIAINLLNNAIKFTHEGHVSLTAERTSDNAVAFHVQDSGIGISSADAKKIFKGFCKLETGFTSNYEGAGLGLTLSQKLAELLGAEITLSSEPGKGSVFTVKFKENRSEA